MRSICLMKEPLCFGEGGSRNISLSPMYVRFTKLHYYVTSPRTVMSGAGSVLFDDVRSANDVTEQASAQTESKAQYENRQTLSLETEELVTRIRKEKCSTYKKK